MFPAGLGAACLAASVGAWPPPPEALEAPARFFADPANQPNDPGFGAECLDALLSFTPDCVEGLPAAEQALGVGVGVDRVWAVTRGGATLALVGSGARLDDPETAPQIWLNAGELPVPDRPESTTVHDANGDGVFDVRDYTTATGTAAPTVERVVDRGLLARPDRGDVNGNGILDPADLIAIYGQDGVDDDGNGFVDDVAGWDFVDGDNDPSSEAPADAVDARRLVATANDGVGTIGVCPRCRLLLLRVAESEEETPVRAARSKAGLAYAEIHGARVAALVRDAEYVPEAESDLLVVQPALRPHPRPVHDGVLLVEGLRAQGANPNGPGVETIFARASDVVTSPLGAPLYEDDRQPVLVAAGGAALLASLPEAPREGWALRSLLVASASSVDGARRLDLPAAVRRFRAGGAVGRLESPRPLSVLNPDRPAQVSFDGAATTLEIDWGPEARAPRQAVLEPVSPGRFEVAPGGRFADPFAAPSQAEDLVVMLRLLGPEGAWLDERPVFFQRAPTLLPDFPVELPAGVVAAPRVDGRGRVWVATLSGQLLRVSPRGEVTVFEGAGSVRAPLSFDGQERPWLADEAGAVWHLEDAGLEPVFEAGPDPGPPVQRVTDGEREVWVRSEGQIAGGRPPRVVPELPGQGPISAFADEIHVGTDEGLLLFVPSSGERRLLFGERRIDWLVTGLDGDQGLALGRPLDPLGAPAPELLRFDLELGEPEALTIDPLRPQGPFAVTSVDRSGGLDVVGVAVDEAIRGPVLYAFDLRNDELVAGFPVPLPTEPEAPVFPLDLDGDARAELIHAAQAFGLMAIGRAGTEVPAFPRLTGDQVVASPGAGDVDGDGRADLVAVTQSGRLFVWRGQGTPPTQWTGAHRDDGATLDLRNELSGRPRPQGGCRSTPASPFLMLLLLSRKRRRSNKPL